MKKMVLISATVWSHNSNINASTSWYKNYTVFLLKETSFWLILIKQFFLYRSIQYRPDETLSTEEFLVLTSLKGYVQLYKVTTIKYMTTASVIRINTYLIPDCVSKLYAINRFAY